MEFKKIDDTKFQCLLYEEDLEDNNISIDDFFRNDTAKIHGLLDVVMEEAQKSIGVIMDSGVMSLQLAPQPNHSILLTISSGQDDFGDMLRQAGERAGQAISSLKPSRDKKNDSNIIKKEEQNKINDDHTKVAPFGSVSGEAASNEETEQTSAQDAVVDLKMIEADQAIFRMESFDDFENFCQHCSRTWGVTNAVYKEDGKSVLFIIEKGRCKKLKFQMFANELLEYGELISTDKFRIVSVKEHNDVLIKQNAVNIIKKIL